MNNSSDSAADGKLHCKLRTLHQNMAMSPEFDAARVGELKQAIASGLYAVNAVRIAEKLLAVEAKLP